MKPWWKRKLPIILLSLALLLVVAGGLLAWWLHQLAPMVKARAERIVSERFDADATIDRLEVQLFPSPHASGYGLVVRKRGRTGPPFLAVRHFAADADWQTLVGEANHRVSLIRLDGLVIQIQHGNAKPTAMPPDANVQASGQTVSAAPPPEAVEPLAPGDQFPFEIEKVIADGAQLVVLPRDPTKQPLIFDIPKLTLRSVGLHKPMSFVATVANAKPPGMVQSTGSFGPWRRASLHSTPLGGDYTFTNANLSVFRGITGTLSSRGKYQGALDRIVVDGTTDTPDFTVSTGQYRVALHTDFHAVVDGVNGNTELDPVAAHFLKTQLVCRGGVEGIVGQPGKTVRLHVTTTYARIEDLLRLCVKAAKPAVMGATSFQTSFVLPPGKEEVMEKLQLNGVFSLPAAQFTDPHVSARIEELSLRSRGIVKKKDQAAQRMEEGMVTSDLSCRMNLANGVATLSDLAFAVPGARIALSGTYGLKSGEIDLHGQARLDARLSHMTTGFKSLLLKLADPFFAKDGAGTVLPIKITGPRDHPEFGLDRH